MAFDPPEKKLTEKQEKFCQEYVIDLNAGAAARRAGYSEKTDYSIGWENLRKPEIQSRIAELRKETASALNITREKVAQELARIAFSDVREVFTEDGALKPISEWPDEVAAAIGSVETDELFEGRGEDREKVGVTRKVKTWDKVKAAEALAKLMGWNSPDKHAFTDPDGKAIAPVINIITNKTPGMETK